MRMDQQHVSIPYASAETAPSQQRFWKRPAVRMLGAYLFLCAVALSLFYAESHRVRSGNLSELIFGPGRFAWLRYIEVGLIGVAGSSAVRMALNARSSRLKVLAVLLTIAAAALVPYLLLSEFRWLVQ